MEKKLININSDLIKELRKRTSIGVLECKEALIKADGNIELAIDNMRKSGLKTASKKSGRATLSGLIAVETTPNRQYGIMIEINCETDFVAKDSTFQEFAKIVRMTALNEKINSIDVLKTRFEAQRSSIISKVRENINIRRLIALTGSFLGSYVHGSKIGVIVNVSGNVTADLVKHIAMHIAAKNPKYINVDDIPKDTMIREYHIQMDIAVKSGKSYKIAEKITAGRMNKFINDIVLIKQNFIMDINTTIEQLLTEYHIRINNFVRFELGENM
ncbi:translation elongation factor Ts [Blochmannia endosymbiont of Camponotus sp.]|uniref:translation elongation factor Ts n=1 Tax=Blochmannia endosymbiont of Camponotus sp. TaxID=700220 RepID=UPI002024ADC8|nr:translation elongation factor Ts [Blochmannia endosymbiont of Camponotus sp.]URJ30104.1 translation elongation factor Ts [Blochmannia endosymbiont of Camponotus sp.]URJ31001.1 translation elongation factor Ts [Blochmannia endosymbiont of Camponotus sp.]